MIYFLLQKKEEVLSPMNVDGPGETSTRVQGASPDLSISSAITDEPVGKEREGTIMDTQDDVNLTTQGDPNSTETPVVEIDRNETRKVNDDVRETSSTEHEMSELEHVGGNVDNEMEVDGNEVTNSKKDVDGDKLTNSQDGGGENKVTSSQNDGSEDKVTNSQNDSVGDAVINSQNDSGEDKVTHSQNDSGEDAVMNSQNDAGENEFMNPEKEVCSTENEMSKVKNVAENQTPENILPSAENVVQQSVGEIVKDTHPTENANTQHDTNDIKK